MESLYLHFNIMLYLKFKNDLIKDPIQKQPVNSKKCQFR